MKQIAIAILAGIICVLSAIAYDTVFQLANKNRQLQLQVDGYKLLLQQQEYEILNSQRNNRKNIERLNEVLTLCINNRPIQINRLQYRCYEMYDI